MNLRRFSVPARSIYQRMYGLKLVPAETTALYSKSEPIIKCLLIAFLASFLCNSCKSVSVSLRVLNYLSESINLVGFIISHYNLTAKKSLDKSCNSILYINRKVELVCLTSSMEYYDSMKRENRNCSDHCCWLVVTNYQVVGQAKKSLAFLSTGTVCLI